MTASKDAMRALAATYLLLPQCPMLFMGEEWGAKQPFPFFCDFEGELADAVRNGRREEFKRFPEFEDPEMRKKIPDPLAESTFASSKLDWNDFDRDTLAHYRALIAARHETIVPLLAGIDRGGRAETIADGAVTVVWQTASGTLMLSANLSDKLVAFPASRGRTLWQEGQPGADFAPWSVRWTLETA